MARVEMSGGGLRLVAPYRAILRYYRCDTSYRAILDGRNRPIVIAESLARVIAAIRIASVRWRSYLPRNTQKLVLTDPAFVATRIPRLAFTRLTFVPHGTAEWLARVDRVR